jgi:hypothetical protein
MLWPVGFQHRPGFDRLEHLCYDSLNDQGAQSECGEIKATHMAAQRGCLRRELYPPLNQKKERERENNYRSKHARQPSLSARSAVARNPFLGRHLVRPARHQRREGAAPVAAVADRADPFGVGRPMHKPGSAQFFRSERASCVSISRQALLEPHADAAPLPGSAQVPS